MSKNRKLEKRVESEVLSMSYALGMSLDVIESKAVYSLKAKRYLRGSAPKGFSDLVGNDKNGTACFIELKEPNHKNNLSSFQLDFLIKKIKSNCFAVCTHGADHFQNLYHQWLAFDDRTQAQAFLMELLTKPSARLHKNI